MNNDKLNIDTCTHKLVKMSGERETSTDFTKNVMSQILKNPSINVNFVSNDDKRSNFWLFIAIGIMVVGYSVYFFVKNQINIDSGIGSIDKPEYLKFFTNFFSNLFSELSLSPYILIALLGVVVLVVMDKTIVRYLYSL